MEDVNKENQVAENKKDLLQDVSRIVLSGLVVVSVLGFVGLIAYYTLNSEDEDERERVFTSILPLVATWMGTVLAYYFSKDNFESANREIRKLTDKVTGREKVLQETVEQTSAKLAVSEIDCIEVENEAALRELSILDDFVNSTKFSGRDRFPIFTKLKQPMYVVHRSVIDRYMVENVVPTPATGDDDGAQTTSQEGLWKGLTFGKFMDDERSQKGKNLFETYVKNALATIDQQATLKEAHGAMKTQRRNFGFCSDVFVTQDGTSNSPTLYWITDKSIEERLDTI